MKHYHSHTHTHAHTRADSMVLLYLCCIEVSYEVKFVTHKIDFFDIYILQSNTL